MLSVAILVKSIDKRLLDLVDQCKEISDDIVCVVNKGSKISVAGTRTVEFEWCDDFSAARNFSFEQCKNDYIIWFDSDDKIDGIEKFDDLKKLIIENGTDWVAMPYIYSETAGEPSLQYKERIFRKGTVKWEKTIHENPVGTIPTKKYLYKNIKIIHLKTLEESQRAQSRNLKYLLTEYNKDKEKTDPRTIGYIARTLTGVAKMSMLSGGKDWEDVLKKANEFYINFLDKSGFMEEKYFAILDLSNNLYILGNAELAIEYTLGAMRMYPNWNMAYFNLGKFHVETSPEKAIEYIEIGLSKQRPKTMLLVNDYEEKIMSKISLIQAYIMTMQIDKAYKIAQEIKKYDLDIVKSAVTNAEIAKETEDYVKGLISVVLYVSKIDQKIAIDILDKIPPKIQDDIRIHNIRKTISPPKIWGDDEIAIVCPFAFERWADPSVLSGIGGSEEAVIYLSRELVKLGFKVTVYNKCRELRGVYNGVEYKNEYEFNPDDSFSTVIAWRSPMYLKDVEAKRKWVWMHDVPNCNIDKDWFDKIIVLSEYHRSLISHIPDEKVMISANGIIPSQFAEPIKKVPNTIFYGSSPDRGLECLVKSIMPLVKKEIPDATLHFCYGWVTFDEMYKDNDGAMLWKKQLLKAAKNVGAIDHGRMSHAQLIKLMGESVVWAYPTQFTEISCCVGDTPILMPRDHKKYPSGIPIKDLVGKKDFYVYAYDQDNERIELGKVLWVKKTRRNAELLKITLDDGTVLRFTPDHKFMMRDGSYKVAKDLKPLDSLMPCYERPTFSIKQPGGHWEDEHRMAAKAKYGDIDGFVIDHKDGDRFNNDIDNLNPITPSQHAKKTFSEQSFHSEKSKEKRISSLKKWLSSDEGKEKLSKNGTNRANKFWSMFREWPEEKQKEWLANRRSKAVNSGAVVATSEQKAAWGKEGAMKRWHNHKIISIEKDSVKEDVYDMEVEKYHNFAAGGVFVHNCITAMKAQCSGCVPVTTDVAALKETVRQGVIVPGGDIYTNEKLQKEFASKVIEQLKNPKKIDTQRAIKEFQWSNISRQWKKELTG